MSKVVISARVDPTQKELFEKFTPYYGKSAGDVMRSLASRWIEANITNPTVIDLSKRGLIKLELTENKRGGNER